MSETISVRISGLNTTSQKINKLYINAKKCGKAKLTRGYLETRYETVNTYWEHFNKQYEQIIEKHTAAELKACELDFQKVYDDTEFDYMDLKAYIKDALYEIKQEETKEPKVCEHSEFKVNRPKLPPISIPTFAGDYQEWTAFRDLFKSLIANETNISTIEKFHYLKSSLSGEAAQLIKHFSMIEANYKDAWKTLESRYDNKRIIVNHILQRLFNQKKLTTESAQGIKDLLDTTKECLSSLKNHKIDTATWDAIVIHLVVSKLDMESLKLWEQSLGASTEIPTFDQLASYLESRFRTMEMISTTQNMKKDTLKTTQHSPKAISMKSFVAETESTCTYCQQNHYICHCKDFAALDVSVRQEFVKNNGICFNCLVKGHSVSHCRQSTSCRKCFRRHHTLLHNTNPGTKNDPTDEQEKPEELKAITMKTEAKNEQVILATAQLIATANNGNSVVLRALIDPGSQASFVTEAAAQILNLDRTSVNGKITGISNTSVVTTKSIVNFNFHSTKNETPQFQVKAYVLRKLTSLLPSQEFPLDTWPTSKPLDFADPDFHKPGSIDVLLGADVHAHILQDGLQRHNSLIAINSHLGWLISGRVAHTDSQKHNVIVNHTKVEVDQLLRQFWEIEEFPSHKKPKTDLEMKCEEHYKNTHTRDTNGRYIVRLPFTNDDDTHLGNSRPLAVSRLQQMEKRFTHKPGFKEDYNNFMKEYISQGHMEKVPERKENITQKKNYYLPHHAVVRPTSLSTKLRVVFDGSAKPEKGNSLNEELMIGPPLQQEIRDLITRWRLHKFCLVADIQKMYRQILVSRDDVDYQRIIWRHSLSEPIAEYRLLTVTYGTSCAPFLAIRTLHQLADDEHDDFPLESAILKTDVYMDDVMTGASTEESAVVLQKRLTELLARGGFPLHKWASNSGLVLSQIPEINKDCVESVNIKIEDTMKTLGITWNSQTDNFELKLNLTMSNNPITKRNVLSAIAKTFDPLGWLAPAVIVLKIFMQKLWLAGLDWDDELPNDLKTEWTACLDSLVNMTTIPFPRWLEVSTNTTRVELHGFSDASCMAYAGVLYLRVWNDNEIKVRLIMAKSKVAPVKQVSLPRLELCGAVLLAKMLNKTKALLNIDDNCVYAWTDSTIVLAWLRKTPNTWTTFVANRTSEILTLMSSHQWHHVKSAENAADPASRGLSPQELQQSSLWWEGPTFLRECDEIVAHDFPVPETVPESKPPKIMSHIIEINEDINIHLSKFSTLSKLVRITAFCFRFIHKCKDRIQNKRVSEPPSYLCPSEIKEALNACIRMSQSLSFSKEILTLSQGKSIAKQSKIFVLNPYLDKDKILRVGGRLTNADISESMKSPILLMHDCHLSKLIVTNAHLKTLHGGHQLTLNYVRQNYWIVRAKNVVKSILTKCVVCFKHRAAPVAPFMGNLPEYRVNPSRPFRTSGVDFAGPFTLKLYSGRCNRTCKAYICLFVCTATKALHLELVSDLTASAFIAAFKRFTARRGHCKDIWSDCGTNFVGASRELDLAFKNSQSQVASEIAALLANDQTNWHFIPPGAPHFGGLWESGVKSVKGHLKRVIGQTSLTFEEYSTLLAQVEACVNSRPLTLLSSSPDELPLTPGHFLVGEPLITVPEENFTEMKAISPLKRWRILTRLVQDLWHRWQLEYLVTLQHRYKWSKPHPDIQLGTVVLVKDDRLPPGKWLLGRVIDKHPGSDGITRVVTLQYKNKIFKRPVTKLCPLPIEE